VSETGPRRYMLKVDVEADAVAPILGLLMKEVEQPRLEPTENGLHRISLICFHDQTPTLLGLIVDRATRFYLGPYVPQAKVAPAVFVAPGPKYTPPQQKTFTRVKGGAKVENYASSRIILSLFKDGRRTINNADAIEVLAANGYKASSGPALLSKLTLEKILVRCGQGVYRLPTSSEQTLAI
jgi:hypothetical protein